MRAFGIILAIVGILMMIFSSINFTTKEKVVDLGPVEINKEKEHSVGWPVYVGGVVLLGGIGLIVAGKKK
jgi:uncharacterized membrane protein